MAEAVVGWTMHTTQSIGLINFELGERTFEQARRLVQAGEARWVHGHCATLKLVPNDYALLEHEWYLREGEPGHFTHERS